MEKTKTIVTRYCDICGKEVQHFAPHYKQWYGGTEIICKNASGQCRYSELCKECDNAINELIQELEKGGANG